MRHLTRYGTPRKGETSTVGSLLKCSLEMLDMAFQESVAIIDDLIRQQMRNLERYGRFIGGMRLAGGEVSIQDARKIVHIRHPKYNRLSNSIIVSRESKLRSSLRKNGGECFGFRPSHAGGNSSSSAEGRFSADDFPEKVNGSELYLVLDVLSFEENQMYEERYLLSNEILDFYCYDNQEYNLVFLGFQQEHELGMLEGFQNTDTFLDFGVGSHNSNLGGFGDELAPCSSSNFDSSPSPTITLKNPEDTSNRLVNRSVNKLKPGREIQTKLVAKNGVFKQVIEPVGYTRTSSFFTANSLE